MVGYRLGRVVKGVAKAALPATKWATQQASTFASEFMRGMTETPKLATDNTIEQDRVDSNVDEQLKQELSSDCLLYTSPSPRDLSTSRMPSSA